MFPRPRAQKRSGPCRFTHEARVENHGIPDQYSMAMLEFER